MIWPSQLIVKTLIVFLVNILCTHLYAAYYYVPKWQHVLVQLPDTKMLWYLSHAQHAVVLRILGRSIHVRKYCLLHVCQSMMGILNLSCPN